MTMNGSPIHAQLRAMVRSAYDLQQLRISSGLRLCANFRAKLGQTAGTTEEELDAEAKEILKKLRESYTRLTDAIARNRNLPPKDQFRGDELITSYTELVLVSQYFELVKVENRQFAQFDLVLPEFPIYNEFLEDILGIGPALAGMLISEIDIHKAKYISSLWKYAGLDVAGDGMGRSRRSEHLVDREYTTKKGEIKTRRSITFNPFLKTKLCGVMGPSFLRKEAPYSELYYSYKHRLETDPGRRKPTPKEVATDKAASEAAGDNEWNPRDYWRKKRIHDAAIRYMIKIFLKDLYLAWRPLEGLPVHASYAEWKFGRKHGERDQAAE